MPTQIFISYAHDDDLPPPESPEIKGFVTYLYEQLRYEFKQLGQPYPTLWQDKRRIADAEQFEAILSDELDRSHLLLVILSNNWLARPYCRLELEHFVTQLAGTGGNPKQRIVVVLKNHIPPELRPQWLQGQVGYSFFAPDETGRAGYEIPYLDRGKVTDDAYYKRVRDLSRYLWSVLHDNDREPGQNLPREKPVPPALPPALNARTIFVAKPAQDMRQAYRRVTGELVARGCTVVPDPEQEIPSDSSAVAFIDAALARAEFSIHLLGKLKGFTPESSQASEPGSPITMLQLQRAALRAPDPAATEDEKPPFRRLIWAPKVLEQVGAPQAAEVARDPLSVLSDFGESVGSGDSIVGDNFDSFLHFVKAYLQKTTPRGKDRIALTAGAQIYVYHRVEDTDYAVDVALALQRRNFDPVLPAWEGDPRELDAFHQQNLRACDKVFLCWANAPEVWVRATARELRALGEGDQSLRRCCLGIVGPPPGSRKAMLLQLMPSKDFAAVHDLTKVPRPSPDDLDPLFR